MFALGDYVVDDRAQRRAHESLISTLIVAEEGGDRLSYDELVALVVNLMLGARTRHVSQRVVDRSVVALDAPPAHRHACVD